MSSEIDKRKLRQSIIKQLLTSKEEEYKSLLDTQLGELDSLHRDSDEQHDIVEDGDPEQTAQRIELRSEATESLQEELEVLRSLSAVEQVFDRVESGAVIETNHGNFIVAVPATAFEVADQFYRGISTSSPLYQALEGKAAGASVQVQGVQYIIQSIY